MRDLTEEFGKKYPGHTREIAAQLLRIDANLLSHGRVALAGGFIRDLFFGLKQPKDWDFAFVGIEPGELLETLRQYTARSPGRVRAIDKTKDSHYDEASGGGRIYMVLGVQEELPCGEVRDMDWILYAADTLPEVAERYDYCLNKFQAFYDENFTLHIHWYGEEWGVCTRNVDSHIPPEREDRFKEMARFLDWEYVHPEIVEYR